MYHSRRIGTREYAGPKAYDKRPGHRDDSLFLAATSPPDTRELCEKHRGSLRIAVQEFSIRVALINPDPIPVMRPLATVSPVEYSLQVSPTKLAILFPLVKRERFSPSSRTNRIAVNHPIPGRLRAILKAFWYRSVLQSWRKAARKKVWCTHSSVPVR